MESLRWIIDNSLRAANSAFMTDNKCALPNQANWSVAFWKRKKKEKGVHRQKNCDIVSTLYYASPPCKMTAMNLLKKVKLDIFHTSMILDWLATFYQSWLGKVLYTLTQSIKNMCVDMYVCVCEKESKYLCISTDVNNWNNGRCSIF